MAQPQPLGFQITFFRTRTPIDPANPSRFAAHQLLIAHAALADPARGALLHEHASPAPASASWPTTDDTDVRLDGWRFRATPMAATTAIAGAVSSSSSTRARRSRCCCRARPASRARDRVPTRRATITRSRISRCARACFETAAAQPHRPRVARSRVVEHRARPRRGGLGLDRHEPRRRHRADRVFDSPQGCGARSTPTRRCVRPVGPCNCSRLRRCASSARHLASPRTGATYPVAQRIHVGPRSFITQPLMADQELDARGTPAPCTGRARAACSKMASPGPRVSRDHRLRGAAPAVNSAGLTM